MQDTGPLSHLAAAPDERTEDRPGGLRCRASALLETLVFLSAVLLLDRLFGHGVRFIDMTLHPFWIIVLLVTLQYGIVEALMAALLASLFLLAGNLPEQSMTETMYAYVLRVAFLPFLWVVTALVLGGVRSRQLQEREQLKMQLKCSETAAHRLTETCRSLKRSKEHLELRLAEERCSVLAVYKVAKALEAADSADTQAALASLVRLSLNPAKFSFYRWQDNALQLEAAYGWEKTDSFARRLGPNAPLTRGIVEHKRHLSVADEKDEATLNGQGMLAGPIVDEKTGHMFGMLKIEELGFMDIGIHAHEIFRVVCEWAGCVYASGEKYRAAAKYQPAASEQRALHIPIPGILQQAIYARSNPRIAA